MGSPLSPAGAPVMFPAKFRARAPAMPPASLRARPPVMFPATALATSLATFLVTNLVTSPATFLVTNQANLPLLLNMSPCQPGDRKVFCSIFLWKVHLGVGEIALSTSLVKGVR